MDWQEFTALLLLTAASSFTPGPNTALSAAIAANLGLASALRFALAVPVGWGLLLALCAAGVGGLVLSVPALRGVLLAVGTAYLLWLALRLARSGAFAEADKRRLHIGFVHGVALQFVNVKAWMLALTVVAGWIAGRPDAALRFAQVLPLMLAFALASNAAYALLGALLRDWLAVGGRLLAFNRTMAAALAATAGWLLYRALR